MAEDQGEAPAIMTTSQSNDRGLPASGSGGAVLRKRVQELVQPQRQGPRDRSAVGTGQADRDRLRTGPAGGGRGPAGGGRGPSLQRGGDLVQLSRQRGGIAAAGLGGEPAQEAAGDLLRRDIQHQR